LIGLIKLVGVTGYCLLKEKPGKRAARAVWFFGVNYLCRVIVLMFVYLPTVTAGRRRRHASLHHNIN
jgi:hypothetical protein